MHRLFPFCRDSFNISYENGSRYERRKKMTTENKITIAMTGVFMAICAGINAFYARRIDKRSEAEFQAYMRNLETRVDNLESDEIDE